MQRAFRRQILRDVPPLATGAEHIQQAVDQLALILLPLAAAALGGRYQRRDHRPFVVGQITRISQIAAVMTGAGFGRPHGGLDDQCEAWTHTSIEPRKGIQMNRKPPGRTLRLSRKR